MKTFISPKLAFSLAAFALVLTGCNSSGTGVSPSSSAGTTAAESVEASSSPASSQSGGTVEITDIYGTVTVPVHPKRVVALDNRTFETLSDWGIELAAVPKGVMPADSPYVSDGSVQDIGSHNEPNLEIIAAVDPELVIIGQRFGNYYDEIKALVPNAAVINLNFDVSANSDAPGDSLVDGLKNSTLALGKIFEKNEEAQQIVENFDKAIENVKSAYNGTDKIMTVVVSGGEIGFSAPGSGRVWGPMYEIFAWVSSLEIDGASSDHKGDDISVEAIAQSNPDWIFVLDRDAAVSSAEGAVPAQDVINQSPALQNVTAVTKNQIIFAPNDTYTNESVQTYLELFENIANAFSK